jgi:hypothetical protein
VTTISQSLADDGRMHWPSAYPQGLAGTKNPSILSGALTEILVRAWHRRKGRVDDNPNPDSCSKNEKLSFRVLVSPPAKLPLTFVWFDPITRGLQKYERFARKICFLAILLERFVFCSKTLFCFLFLISSSILPLLLSCLLLQPVGLIS